MDETCQRLEDLPARRSMRRWGRVCEGDRETGRLGDIENCGLGTIL